MQTAKTHRPFNRLRFILDRKLTVANALDKAARAHPDATVFLLDAPVGYGGLGTRVTVRQLQAFADRMAHVLTGPLGMARYERVAIVKRNAGDYFFLALAVMRAGGIAVPINAGLAPEALRRYLDDTGCCIVLSDRATLARFDGVLDPERHRLVAVDAPRDEGPVQALEPALQSAPPAPFAPVSMAADDDVLLVHTSGTTGFPKAVIHTSGSLVAGVRGQLLIEPVFRHHLAMSASPFNHFINHLGLLSALLARVPTWLMSSDDPDTLLRHIDRERVNVVFCFPHTYLAMYRLGLDRYDLGSVKLWLAGADSSHEAHIKAFTRKGALLRLFGRPLIRSVYVDTLGSSEVGFAALFRFTFSFSRRFDRYVGKPTFAGPKVKVADERGRPLPPGRIGRLMVKGPTLFKGYWNAHDRLHGVVLDGWWWTGDVVLRDARGRHYHLDRHSDVIRGRDGEIYTLPLEERLLKEPGVLEAVVVARADDERGEVPVALIQPMPGARLDAEALRARINAALPAAQALAEIHLVDEADIPRGLTGKVLKRCIRDALPAA